MTERKTATVTYRPEEVVPPPAPHATVPEFLHAIADAYEDRPAITHGDEVLTYRELERASASLALGLLANGVGKGTRVGLLLGNSPRWAVAWAAVCRIGAVCVPLSTLSRAAELARLVRHGDLAVLLAQPSLLSQDFETLLPKALPSLGETERLFLPEAPFLRLIAMDDAEPPAWAMSFERLRKSGEHLDDAFLRGIEAEVHADDDGMMIYTSGQSADPKGVLHRQGSVVIKAYYLSYMLGMEETTEYAATMPFFWVGGLVMGLLTTFAAGGVVHCTDRTEGLGRVIGAPVTDPLPLELRSRLPSSLGMSETFGMYAFGTEFRVEERPIAAPLDVFQPGTEVKVVDPEGNPVEDGKTGEILVRGPSVAVRLNKVDRSYAYDDDGFYRTGDQGLVDGKRIHFLGRLGDMIKTSGANVAPAEVERELLGLDGIQAAHVVGLEDPKLGQAVAAAIVPSPGSTLDLDDVRAKLRERLSSYKVPKHFVLLRADEVPKTPTDKVRKTDLRELLSQRVRAGY